MHEVLSRPTPRRPQTSGLSVMRRACRALESSRTPYRALETAHVLHTPLFPVLVTGIQCAASAARETSYVPHRFSHRADARWLDSCDEHRNEGGVVVASLNTRLPTAEETVQ